ncbi:hypothetical protein ACFVW1_36180, partial [Streptomyces olivochromogenes]|uniref:hypothetical protein n=1 Tax=Streptomyces olivochromogenes TaxID=1963 RepID=UPI0036DE9A05
MAGALDVQPALMGGQERTTGLTAFRILKGDLRVVEVLQSETVEVDLHVKLLLLDQLSHHDSRARSPDATPISDRIGRFAARDAVRESGAWVGARACGCRRHAGRSGVASFTFSSSVADGFQQQLAISALADA